MTTGLKLSAVSLSLGLALSGCGKVDKEEAKAAFSEERAQSIAENISADYITNELAWQDAVQFAQTGKLVNLPGDGLGKLAAGDTIPLQFNSADSSWFISVTKPKGAFTYSLYLYNKSGKKQTIYVKGNTTLSTYSMKWTIAGSLSLSRTGTYQSANRQTLRSDLTTTITLTGVNESATQVVVSGSGADSTFSSWTGLTGKTQEASSKLTFTYTAITFPKSSDTSPFPISGSADYTVSHTFAHSFTDTTAENGKTVSTTAKITFAGTSSVTITVGDYTFLLNLETKTITRADD